MFKLVGRKMSGGSRSWCAAVLLLVTALLCRAPALAAAPASDSKPATVWVLTLDDAIGPAVAHWFVSSLDEAQEAGAALFVLRLNTPGGLDKAMRTMIQAILASSVPVVTYVSPSGSRAASAGTYILYASHIAAMAPATNVGAASPVVIGGSSDDDSQNASTEQRKRLNDAAAYIEGLARLRDRNADWAAQAVRKAVSLSANEALKKNVVDLLAPDLPALLHDLNGRQLSNVDGHTVTLDLTHYRLHQVSRDWRTDFLAIITNPTIAYILLLAGFYGLIIEFIHPGTGVPGVLGAICLLLGLYALQMLPISYVGLGLMILGIGLVAGEAFFPSYGALGVGGVAAFVIGSLMLMDTDLPAFRIAIPVIAAVGVGSVLLVGVLIRMTVKAHHPRPVTGDTQLVGAIAVALSDFDGIGQARVNGEVWRVRAAQPVRRGDRLRVQNRDGLTLNVEIDS